MKVDVDGMSGGCSAPPRSLDRKQASNKQSVKLQHFLILKAFNLRKNKHASLDEQFRTLKRIGDTRTSSDDYLELDELCSYLSVPPFRQLVLRRVFRLGDGETKINYNSFLEFLRSAIYIAADKERRVQELPTPPRWQNRSNQETTDALTIFQPSALNTQQSTKPTPAPPAPGAWKKREITIQEHITEYTKIDELGNAQKLVEREKHQQEIVHMESGDGEFAHREITHFEQTEHLNDDIVHQDQGKEEFIHLKSKFDEISRFDTSMPAHYGGARQGECEDASPSPKIKQSSGDGNDQDNNTGSMFFNSDTYEDNGYDHDQAGLSQTE